MRFSAIIAATATSTALFAVLGVIPVHAEPKKFALIEPPAQEQLIVSKIEKKIEPPVTKIEEKVVEVKPGDYLSKIAQENQTTYNRVFDANPVIKDPNVIYPGDKLRIPRPDEKLDSRIPETPAPQVVAAAPVASPKKQTQQVRQQPVTTPTADISGDVWDQLARCESGGNWAINTGNGYYGGLQFSLGSWRGVGGVGYPHQASREEQIARGKMLQARQGWGAWPACTRKMGIR